MYVLFKTGMRISEFTGLTLSDLDMKNRTINIDHQLQKKGTLVYIDTTKTYAGKRVIPMTDGVYEAFKNILAARPKFKVEPMIDGYSGFLWFDKDGKPMVAMHWEKYFKHAVDRYNSIYRVQLPKINEVFHTQLDNYAEMDEIQFVYSPTHMEEVCRMDNSIFEGKRRDNISKICSNCEVLPVRDGCLKILTEPVEVCFDRAKKFQVLNQYAEESECATFEALEEKTCGLLRWDEKEVETHRKEISLLTSTQLFDPKNEMIDNESINRVFYEICGSRFPVEDFKDYCKKERTFSEIREAVRLLFILMNALGYHRNKIEKRTKFTYKAFYPTYDREFYRTIRSGFYDVDHICYASKCNYFVTCDYALSSQAMEIYRYLGCKTNVIYCEKKAPDPSLPLAVLCKKTATP